MFVGVLFFFGYFFGGWILPVMDPFFLKQTIYFIDFS